MVSLPKLGEVMDVKNNERDRLQTRTRQMRCHVLATPFRARSPVTTWLNGPGHAVSPAFCTFFVTLLRGSYKIYM